MQRGGERERERDIVVIFWVFAPSIEGTASSRGRCAYRTWCKCCTMQNSIESALIVYALWDSLSLASCFLLRLDRGGLIEGPQVGSFSRVQQHYETKQDIGAQLMARKCSQTCTSLSLPLAGRGGGGAAVSSRQHYCFFGWSMLPSYGRAQL